MKKVLFYFLCLLPLFASPKNTDIFHYLTSDINLIPNEETKDTMYKWLNSDFGLEPYRVNYLLPFGYRKSGTYKSYIPTDVYKKIEAELQISLKLNVKHNILGLDERYYLAYTHQSFWQIYSESSPFRETIYNPEAFVLFPIKDRTFLHLKSFKLALAHRSNGQGDNRNLDPQKYSNIENRSRSMNYYYTTFRFQHLSMITDLKFWARIPEKNQTDDNPDIMKYTGFSSIKVRYFLNRHMVTLLARVNFKTDYGAIEATYSHPLIIDDVYFYTKFFTGYGESLIDYNNNITKFSVGFSFSR